MRITKQVLGRTVLLGGEEPSGWLPANAAIPLATPVNDLVFDIRIIETEGGFITAWQSRTTDDGSDYWHETLEAALEQAEISLGIKASEWEDGDEEFEGDG